MGTSIEIKSKLGSINAYLVKPDADVKLPGVILIHEVWGLVDHIRDVADRLSNEGYVVLAPDLISETGIPDKLGPDIMKEIANPATRDEAQKKFRATLTPLQSPEFSKATVERLNECFNYLKSHKNINGKIAVLGFCFGGTYSFSLACNNPDLSAAIVFYGYAPSDELLSKINCPVYGFYGENDHVISDRLPELNDKLKALGKDFKFEVYPDTGHAFFNDTNPNMYRKEPANDSWIKALTALRKHLNN